MNHYEELRPTTRSELETATMTPSESLVRELVSAFPEMQPLLVEHLEDQDDEVLPYLLMADVARWSERKSMTDPDRVAQVTGWLEARFDEGDETSRTSSVSASSR